MAAPLSGLSRNGKATLRRRSIGYVFQDYNLLAGLSAAGERLPPARARRRAGAQGARRRRSSPSRSSDWPTGPPHYPDQLSGGERQRVAIARAVVGGRKLLLADEPSGALDSTNARAVMRLVLAACHRGLAAVVVTHDAQLASWADRVVFLRDGRDGRPDLAVESPETLPRRRP